MNHTRHIISLCVSGLTLILAGTLVFAASGAGIFEAHGDIGITPKAGAVEYNASSAEYRVTGGGANAWGTTDAFHYVWKRISGDFTLTADVKFTAPGGQQHRQASLAVRQTLDPGSAVVRTTLHGDGSVALQFRPAAGAPSEQIQSKLKAPGRIRLQRRGDEFLMFAGDPGGELQPAGPTTVVFQGPVYVGLAVCAHDAGALETALFSNVKLENQSR